MDKKVLDNINTDIATAEEKITEKAESIGMAAEKNIAVRLVYDGTNYHGWQYQNNAITVQQAVEEALSKLLGKETKVTGCSRTDAGVHALDYVMNFHSDTRIPPERLTYALNHYLENDITAVEAWGAEQDFNARFSSSGKRYVYKIWNSRIRNPFYAGYSWYVPYNLDFDAMVQAAAHFEGKHDFSAFMAAGGSQKTTVRTIRHCGVTRGNGDEPQNLITVTVEADAFLYNMVRIITGTLAEVGFGRIKPDDIKNIINSGRRSMSGLTAPPEGLFLKKVYY